MNSATTFQTPTPKPWLMKMLNPVNEVLLLKGIPLLRDIPWLNKIPGVRGITQIRHIDLPANDLQRLKQVSGKNKATFYLPNHPEFFTDWMVDKYVLSKVAPTAASWATSYVVNGMGKLMQRFWLNNNLIAQVPGESGQGKASSITVAVKGQGVLLHPEGHVSWDSKHIAPLFAGAAQMAQEAYQQGRKKNEHFTAWLAPMVWKLRFNQDVKAKLLNECGYIERCLKLSSTHSDCAAQRVYQIYLELGKRDYYKTIQRNDCFADMHLSELQDRIIAKCKIQLTELTGVETQDHQAVLRKTSKWLRENKNQAGYKTVKDVLQIYKRWLRLNSHSYVEKTISQEEIAEHLKRIRSDFCNGSLRDTINAYLPQAAGPRTVHIRACEPLAIHSLVENNDQLDAADTMRQVRCLMQHKLDHLNDELKNKFKSINVLNPFYYQAGLN